MRPMSSPGSAALGLALLAATPLPAAAPSYPPQTLVLFVASWCAPCRAELRHLDEIAAAATPVEVRVTPIDQSSGTAAMLRDVPPARIWRSAHTVNAYAQSSGLLPFSIMTDAQGRTCATHDRALDPVSVTAMRHHCDGASAKLSARPGGDGGIHIGSFTSL